VNQKEHCLGLAYVAISRVKALSFESVFDFDRFKLVDSINSRDRDLDYRTRETLTRTLVLERTIVVNSLV
jgi:hypothetical protein